MFHCATLLSVHVGVLVCLYVRIAPLHWRWSVVSCFAFEEEFSVTAGNNKIHRQRCHRRSEGRRVLCLFPLFVHVEDESAWLVCLRK